MITQELWAFRSGAHNSKIFEDMTKEQIKYRISKLMRAMDYHTDAIAFHKAEQTKILKKIHELEDKISQ